MMVARFRLMLHSHKDSVFLALGVPSMDREHLVTLMESDLSLQFHSAISVNLKPLVGGVKNCPRSSTAVIENNWNENESIIKIQYQKDKNHDYRI